MTNDKKQKKQAEKGAVKQPDKVLITDKLGVVQKCECGKRQTYFDEKMTSLEDIINTQCQTGNWDYDPYQYGLANGLLLAFGILTGRQPAYLPKPKKWKADEKKNSGIILP